MSKKKVDTSCSLAKMNCSSKDVRAENYMQDNLTKTRVYAEGYPYQFSLLLFRIEPIHLQAYTWSSLYFENYYT